LGVSGGKGLGRKKKKHTRGLRGNLRTLRKNKNSVETPGWGTQHECRSLVHPGGNLGNSKGGAFWELLCPRSGLSEAGLGLGTGLTGRAFWGDLIRKLEVRDGQEIDLLELRKGRDV